jgi:hypothetical protein
LIPSSAATQRSSATLVQPIIDPSAARDDSRFGILHRLRPHIHALSALLCCCLRLNGRDLCNLPHSSRGRANAMLATSKPVLGGTDPATQQDHINAMLRSLPEAQVVALDSAGPLQKIAPRPAIAAVPVREHQARKWPPLGRVIEFLRLRAVKTTQHRCDDYLPIAAKRGSHTAVTTWSPSTVQPGSQWRRHSWRRRKMASCSAFAGAIRASDLPAERFRNCRARSSHGRPGN